MTHTERTEQQVRWSGVIGPRIKYYREGLGWSRTRLAAECQTRGYGWLGISTLAQIERNDARKDKLRRNITIDELVLIADVMGVSAREFLRVRAATALFERHHYFDLGWRARQVAEKQAREAADVNG